MKLFQARYRNPVNLICFITSPAMYIYSGKTHVVDGSAAGLRPLPSYLTKIKNNSMLKYFKIDCRFFFLFFFYVNGRLRTENVTSAEKKAERKFPMEFRIRNWMHPVSFRRAVKHTRYNNMSLCFRAYDTRGLQLTISVRWYAIWCFAHYTELRSFLHDYIWLGNYLSLFSFKIF